MATVTLHIGAFKTGTSFIQSVLMNSRDTLKDLGFLWPGDSWADVVEGVQGLRGKEGCPYGPWGALVRQADDWSGDTIVSMEFLSILKPDAIKRAVESLSMHRVRVVLTMRDVGRAVPAQWQESVQTGSTWSYSEYCEGLGHPKEKESEASRHFWKKQDPVRILSAWHEHLAAEDLILVTVPPQGSPSNLLWERFCTAAGLPPERFDATIRVNESLGAYSAEVMRHVMTQANVAEVGTPTRRAMKKILAKKVLPRRRAEEPTLVLPPGYHAWAINRGKQMVDGLNELGPVVVGDLDDLIPQFRAPHGPTTTDPSTASPEDLMAAAAYGLVGMATQVARRGIGKGRLGSD